MRARQDKFALTKVEREAKVATALLEQAKGTRQEAEVSSKDVVVQVESGQFQLGAAGPEPPQFVDQRLDGKGEEERPKGIPLLNTHLGGEFMLSEKKARRLSIAPLSPTGKLGELGSDLGKGFSTVNAVERVLEIKFEKTLGGA